MDGVGGWPEITFHFTPVDDENHVWFITAKVGIGADEVERFLEKRAEFMQQRAAAPPISRLVDDIWRGKLAFAEARHPELVIVQDVAVQAGQGRIADREAEYLGRSDVCIVAWRRILARELRAIAEGRPPKTWTRPPADVVPTLGVTVKA
jgi:hypothetical protein